MSTPATKPRNDEIRAAVFSFKHAFFTVALFSMVLNVLALSPSIYMLQVYDRVLVSRNVTTLVMLSLLVVGVYILMGAMEATRTFVLTRVGARMDVDLNRRVFTAAFQRNLMRPGSNTAQALGDLTAIRQTLTGTALVALFDLPWLPIYMAVIFMFSFELGMFSLGAALLLGILAVLNEIYTRDPLNEAQKYSMAATNMAQNNLRNAEVIEAMGMLPQIRARWYELHAKFLKLQGTASDRAGILQGMSKFVRITMQSLVLGYGALKTLEGDMTAGMMIAASIIVGRALAPVDQLIASWKQLVSGRAAYRRLKELLEMHPAADEGMPLPAPKGKLSVESVLAGPPGSRMPILKGVSFSVEPGEIVAMIGPSASGKSTLARLLMGVWAPMSGHVRLDGADVYAWNKLELGPHLGYLPQDIELFDGTIAENIARFGEIDAEKVVEAAMRTGMHEHILKLSDGYDTRLGDAASSLSGGQRQRIGLARAIYGDPALIVLDEPNSNLDDQGELALVETIKDLKARGRTVILITHRMSTLSVVDNVLVLQDGTVKAYGPRDKVLAPMMQARAAQARPGGMPPGAPGMAGTGMAAGAMPPGAAPQGGPAGLPAPGARPGAGAAAPAAGAKPGGGGGTPPAPGGAGGAPGGTSTGGTSPGGTSTGGTLPGGTATPPGPQPA